MMKNKPEMRCLLLGTIGQLTILVGLGGPPLELVRHNRSEMDKWTLILIFKFS
jgi:hypothetical protein